MADASTSQVAADASVAHVAEAMAEATVADRLVCGVMEGAAEHIVLTDADARPKRSATFAISNFALVGCELAQTGSSAAELEVVKTELLGAPIDPEVVRSAGSVSAALAAIAINASNFACVRLNTIWKDEGRAANHCAVLPIV